MPTVSVIVPNYNHAPYLRQRIETILAQTFTDLELILLDDCSTDGSREILETYCNHPKVSHLVINSFNSGSPFRQWQKGIGLATGDYIWIAESDDYSAPDFLEKCVGTLERNPHCAVAFTSSYIYEQSSGKIRENAPMRGRSLPYAIYRSRHFAYRYLLVRNAIFNSSMAVVRRSALPQSDSYSSYRYCGDWLFWIHAVRGGDVAYIPEPLNYYRIHAANITAESIATGRKHLETLRILTEAFDLYRTPFLCRRSIAGKHYCRIRREAGSNWNEEPYLNVRGTWRTVYRCPVMQKLHKVYKLYPR